MASGVECVKFGVTEQLIMCLNRYPYNYARDIIELEISLNVDGLPLFKSTGKSFWPVLCTVHLKPASTFPLAIALTEAKPKSLDFIKVIADELNMILMNGFSWGETTVSVRLRCITCDAPAKAMLKCIKQFSGYYGCDKCTQKGNWEGRMTYQQVHDLILRDDVSFREQHQPEHHQENTVSPFSDLQIGMVKSFPADYMHQCCLGVMRKMLLLWSRGKSGYRISPAQLREVNQRLRNLRCDIPHIFARKPRSLDEVERWKATEFRQFMLYTGKVVLRGVLPETLYSHFMAFSVAMCILVSPHLTQTYNMYAHELLTYFVEQGRHIYGKEFLVYNVHSLLHLTADATTYGSLDRCSAFAFESYLHQLKKMVGFYVVVFDEENSIAVAPASWVEEVNGVLICYWPRKNADAMAKAFHRPDKELWKQYKIRILSETDKPPNDISVSAHAPEEDVPSLPNLSSDNPFHVK
ncbi:transposase domain-containing protein [Labeo rohita]|uniref:Transposase domain-containing protein n=1 Tax=Labeo rohita TaxID=84645 RepID=A0A498P2E3_LABRO|nr:transposase domain-containing protein [Labeo rohita]